MPPVLSGAVVAKCAAVAEKCAEIFRRAARRNGQNVPGSPNKKSKNQINCRKRRENARNADFETVANIIWGRGPGVSTGGDAGATALALPAKDLPNGLIFSLFIGVHLR